MSIHDQHNISWKFIDICLEYTPMLAQAQMWLMQHCNIVAHAT